jgi:hypothetical protein
VITDFFLGSVPQERAAGALISCYRHLGLTPKKILVFRDILPSSDSEDGPADIARALDEAQHLYAICGKALLSRCGATKVKDRLKRRLGKYDLVVQADAGVGWTMVD